MLMLFMIKYKWKQIEKKSEYACRQLYLNITIITNTDY